MLLYILGQSLGLGRLPQRGKKGGDVGDVGELVIWDKLAGQLENAFGDLGKGIVSEMRSYGTL